MVCIDLEDFLVVSWLFLFYLCSNPNLKTLIIRLLQLCVICVECFVFFLIYFNLRIITWQYCDGFCHTSAWIGHRYTSVPCILNPPPTSLLTLSLWVIPEPWLWVPCFMHQTCPGHLFYIWKYTCFSAILSNHATLAFSHRVQKSVLYICVSFAVLHIGSSLLSF